MMLYKDVSFPSGKAILEKRSEFGVEVRFSRLRYMRLFQRILALRLDLGGMQERMPASCRLARMIGDW
jgi:hypothetical protein